MIFYCGFVVHITDTRAQKVVSYISAHIQPFGCLIVQVRQAVQSMRRSVDWTMGVGRGGRGKAWSPLDFEIISKKSFFSISRGKKRISPLLEPPWKKFWENPLLPPPLDNILPTPMDWTLEDNMVDGLFFCSTLTGRRGGHNPFVHAGAETSDTGAEAVKPDRGCSW